MSSDLDKSGNGTETVGHKIDALSASVDERFDAVDAALVEQRQYTDFAFDRLMDEMKNGFEAVNGRLIGIDGRLEGIGGRFNRLERKLDQFIDTQSGPTSRSSTA